MTALTKLRALLSILALTILACGATVDLGLPKLIRQDVIPTMVAQTLQALTQQALVAIPTSTPRTTRRSRCVQPARRWSAIRPPGG